MIPWILLLIIWIIGAALTVKAEAMDCNTRSDWSIMPIALVCWPIVAVLHLFIKHRVCRGCDAYQLWEYYY